MMTVLTCSLDLTTSMGMATSQLQIPAIPPANSVDQIESPVLTKLRLKYILAENWARIHFPKCVLSNLWSWHIFLSFGFVCLKRFFLLGSYTRWQTNMYQITEIIVSVWASVRHQRGGMCVCVCVCKSYFWSATCLRGINSGTKGAKSRKTGHCPLFAAFYLLNYFGFRSIPLHFSFCRSNVNK